MNIRKLLEKGVEKIKESDGFMTKAGQILDRSEVHAFGLGLIPYSMAFYLQIPWARETMFMVGLGALGVKGFRKIARKVHGDVLDESHYFWLGMGLVELTAQHGDTLVALIRSVI